MKKLVMFVVAAALAFAGQAATVSWAATYAGKGADWSSNGAFIMAFAGDDYNAIIKLVTVDGSDSLQADLAAKSLGSSTFSNFRGSAKSSDVAVTDAPATMFWMVFSDGSYDGGKAVTWTAAIDVSSSYYTPPEAGTMFGVTAASFANSGTIASIPEPTSGILLLVGMAGLALRRKRA